MRQGADNFDVMEMEKIMGFLRESGRKGYLALNVMVYDGEIAKVREILRHAKKAGIDAVIAWDAAVIRMAREEDITVHLSTQASVSNFEALRVYNELGASRIVLARESSLKDIKSIVRGIKENGIACGIETFVHGAMCLSLSGRCLLSHETFLKSANRGECLQPCRREYTIKDKDGECEYVLGEDHILSAKDLCTIDFLDELIVSGVEAFKIEGRNRPPEYVAEATAVYREGIDLFFEGALTVKKKEDMKDRLSRTFNRGFTSGFYFGRPPDAEGDVPRGYEKTYLGEVIKFYKKIGVAEVSLMTGDLAEGDKMLITGKKTPASFLNVKEMEIEHMPVKRVKKGERAGIKLSFAVRPGDKVFVWREK